MPRRDPALEDAVWEIAVLVSDVCFRQKTTAQLKDCHRETLGREGAAMPDSAIAGHWTDGSPAP